MHGRGMEIELEPRRILIVLQVSQARKQELSSGQLGTVNDGPPGVMGSTQTTDMKLSVIR